MAESAEKIELSVVMPCLNEAETLEVCIRKIQQAFARHGIKGEIIVADNGSTDGSQEIAVHSGARLVRVAQRGYGNALMGGIGAARGVYVVMGDADDSYDFADIPTFLARLGDGYDLVMGNRFSGGIAPGAMPPLHKYLGNPVLTFIGRLLFKSPVGDFHCGLRGFRRDAVLQLDLRTTGMEFASEMVVKATLHGMRIAEVPTTLAPDGRSRPPHLRSWRDGWRHLRFMLMYSPRWLFLYPGVALMVLGVLTVLWLLPGPRSVGPVEFDVHTMLYAAMAVIAGCQAISFAAFTKLFAVGEGLLPEDTLSRRLGSGFSLEAGLVAGGCLLLSGLGLTVGALSYWGAQHFGSLDPTHVLRLAIPGATMVAVGLQLLLSSFFLSILRLGRR